MIKSIELLLMFVGLVAVGMAIGAFVNFLGAGASILLGAVIIVAVVYS